MARNDPGTRGGARGSDVVRMLQVDDLEVEITVRRVRRMNLGVHPPDGRVLLSVPTRTSDRAVARFVRESRSWIDRHQRRVIEEARSAAARPVPPVLRGVDGEVWSRFGQALRLRVLPREGRPRVVVRPDRVLEVHLADPEDHAAVLRALDRWQRDELRTAAQPLLAHWCDRVGVHYDFLGLRRMSTRWGSCVPAKGRIWLNVALVERAPDLLEYVVVHEVVHLRELSHGPRFRALMDAHLPDWRELRRRLDAGGSGHPSGASAFHGDGG